MIKFIIYLLIGYFALKIFKSVFGQGTQARMGTNGRRSDEIDDLMVKDPNCQTYIPRRDAVQAEQNGEIHYFCSSECRDAYLEKL
ncbi:MAG: hypothetical protein GY697_07475 [Desulfobacterales bacterium]|nr:hypothetical protein [Desulfobacterales bacterium]